MKTMLKEELEKHFRPEFLNRVDDIVFFRPLTREDLKSIIDIELSHVRERIRVKGHTLALTDAAKEFIIEQGYNPEFGARPLRRSVERLVEDPLSENLLAGRFPEGAVILIDTVDNQLVFKEKPEPAPVA